MLMTAMYEGEMNVILLAWTTLQMTLPQKLAAEKFDTFYYKFTKAALKENVFLSMYQIVSDPILQNCCITEIIRKTFYNLLDYICDMFDENGSILEHMGVVQLCTELIKDPSIADRFLHECGEKASIVYRILYEMFPCTFESYSAVVFQLIQHDNLTYEVLTILNNLEYFTEEYTEKVGDCVVNLMEPYVPFECVTIKNYSEAFIFSKYGKTFVKYQTNYSYFALSEEKAGLAILKRQIPENSLTDIELSYNIIETLLKKVENKPEQVKAVMEGVCHLLINTSKKPHTYYRLMSICLDIYKTLMKTHSEQIVDLLIVNNFLPFVTKAWNDLNNYYDKNFLNPNIILLSIGEQLTFGDYDILFSYINLIKTTPKTNQNILKVKIPGVVFLFIHLFPMHLDAIYKQMHEKHKITQLCLEYLLDVLNSTYDKLNEYDKIIYNFCYGIVVNYEPTVQVLIRIFRTSNMYLHTRMLKELDWNNGLTFTITDCVKTCMNIFMKILSLHNKNERSLNGTKFYTKFFDSDTKPSSLKILIGYLNHAFDPAVPKLACQLLKKVAHNPTIPFLALLEMDNYQIQSAFLEKLRDPLEEDGIKIAILELITLSIEKQDGLTAAFFDLRQYPSKRRGTSVDIGDSITVFMEEYLDNIKKSTSYLNSPVQAAVLDLFHTLWTYKKDILVEQLTKHASFWETLTDPLFRELKLSNRTYSQILNILTFELFKSKGENTTISAILDKFFSKDSHFTKLWCTHVLLSLDKDSPLDGHSVLRSWKNLVMAVVLTYPQCLEEPTLRTMMTETCINGLIQHFEHSNDIRILISWADLYLFLIKKWPSNYYKDHKEIFMTLTKVFKYVGEHYNHVNSTFKETMLCIAIQTIQDLHKFITVNHELTENYLQSIGNIFEKEYLKISTEQAQLTEEKAYNEWLLLLVFGNNLMLMNFVKLYPNWFCFTQFMHKVVKSIGLFTTNPAHFSVAKIGIQCLINYAETDMVYEFMDVDFEAFCDSIRPSKRFINTDILTFKNAIPWHFEEWWLTYTGLVQLMTILLQKIHAFNLNMFFSYASIHEDIIRNTLKLPKVTAEKTALNLTSTCLHFVYQLLLWKQEWKVAQPQSFFSTMRSIYETINAVTCIFLRPKILTFFTFDKKEQLCLLETVPVDLLTNIMDELMRLIGISCLCLVRAGPSLPALLQSPLKVNYITDATIEFDFHIPQVHEENPHKITYGTVLCLLHFLCKTLTYIHAQRVSPQKQTNDQTVEKLRNVTCLAFVCPDYAGGYTISERYSSLSSDISGLSAWKQLKIGNVIFALEALASVISIQTYISFSTRDMKYESNQHIKRELCSELIYFYEFVRKRFADTNHYRTVENMVYRRYLVYPLPYGLNITEDMETTYAKRITTDSTISDEEKNTIKVPANKRSSSSDHGDFERKVYFSREDFETINVGHSKEAGDTTAGTSKNPSSGKFFVGQKIVNARSIKMSLNQVVLQYQKPPKIKNSDYLLCLTHWLIFFCDLSH